MMAEKQPIEQFFVTEIELFKNIDSKITGKYCWFDPSSQMPYYCVVIRGNKVIRNKWRVKEFAEAWINKF
jgi:hypothetical protein